ncbi:L domain-like protein [Piedraia hortae CBS 480.64]|uniref:L domain-like protein n=1 Tax=Piedraia hortae CBS 480.64 TaxID=1314780 RepID=A0A6A7C609_9PEZI|nr:L domain-like protein [Piedraia hortae CBS 480.64]
MATSKTSGWDGKLRVTLSNPEALEGEASDSSNDGPPVERIAADEDLLEDEDPETEEIELQHARITSMPALKLDRFPHLRRLGLRQNQIQKILLPDPIASTLEELELYDNLIKHVSGLENCLNLEVLDLSYNKLKHVKNISHLTKLHHLYLVQNRLTKIEGIDTLTELTYLELGANRIKDLQGLSTLTRLQHLWLGQNRISSLEGLSTLSNLKTLSIQANRLTSLDGIESLPQLTELYISDNKIPSLEPLSNLTGLEMLDFQSNPVANLRGLEGMVELENVWASFCRIEDFGEVERALRDKKKLQEVYFEGNPLQVKGPVVYRNKVRLALPQVGKIDASYVKT